MQGYQDKANPRLGNPAPRKGHGLLWGIVIFLLLLIAAAYFGLCADASYIPKSKMSKVVSALDPVKQSLILAYREKGKLPQVTTAITQANQGTAATPDWAALGFETLPSLPKEASSLTITPEGEIVVTLANIGEGIDGTEVRAIAMKEVMKKTSNWTWEYECTSVTPMLRKFFRCR